jgi:hypothetical protein
MNDEVAAFVNAARSFCSFMERPAAHDDVELAAKALAALYAAGLSLPAVEPGSAETAEYRPRDTPIPRDLGAQYYYEVVEPLDLTGAEDVVGDLDDDLLDIYKDVKEGLGAFDAGHVQSAGWHWRFTLEAHWGDHAVDALRVLHRLVVKKRR